MGRSPFSRLIDVLMKMTVVDGMKLDYSLPAITRAWLQASHISGGFESKVYDGLAYHIHMVSSSVGPVKATGDSQV